MTDAPALSLPDAARITVSADHDLPSIVTAAGGSVGEGGSLYENGVLIVPNVTQSALDAALAAYDPSVAAKRALLAYAASVRYAKVTGGFTYAGKTIATDSDSRSNISGAALGATVVGSSFSTQWKANDGSFFTLNQAGMLTMATAVLSFVSACYAAEAIVAAAITAGTITTTAQVDAASWPSSTYSAPAPTS